MNQSNKIEILMATYNGEKYIREQIDSIINQTYKNWKLLIRDDGSADKTIEILKEYKKQDNRIKIIEDNKGNLGFVKNFEELLKNSSENFIMFSDQDDYWLENKIEEYIKIINTLSEEKLKNKPLLIHSNSYVCDDKLNIIKDKFIDSNIAKSYKQNSYYFYCIVQGSTILINRKMIDIGVPFLKKTKLHDRYFHFLSEFLGNRLFINKSLMKYRQHTNNEIGANRKGIIEKILKKRYFEENDRELILEIKEKYKEKINKEIKEQIENYLNITDRKKSRFIRFYISKNIKMNIKKRIFLLFKG